MTEEYVQICFEVISRIGVARSLYVEAINQAREGNFGELEELFRQADELFVSAQNTHLKLLQQEANGENVEVHLILIHAEDLMATTETIKILADEFIELYRRTKQ